MSYQPDEQVMTLLKAIRGDAALIAGRLNEIGLRLSRIEVQLIELHGAVPFDPPFADKA